jgi:EAL domain-containing protein (putative c-di-GMP-specific phosphodiesterase class I)
VVAQGVETVEQIDFLQRNACDELQGFYFNRPLGAAAFEQLLRRSPKSSFPPSKV